MGYLRRFFVGASAPTVLPRRYVWRVASHGLFGVAGLDPCGNVLLRWREGSSASGGWIRAQLLEDARVFPLHWEAAVRATSGTPADKPAPPPTDDPAASKQPGTNKTTTTAPGLETRAVRDELSGVLRILPAAKMTRRSMKRGYRLRPHVTMLYKTAYYAAWLAAAFGILALYFFVKQELASYWGRRQMSRIEDALLDAVEDMVFFVRRLAIDFGFSESTVLKLDAAIVAIKAAIAYVMVKAGYDYTIHELDRARDDVEEEVERGITKWENRKVATWQLLGWLSVVITVVVFFFL